MLRKLIVSAAMLTAGLAMTAQAQEIDSTKTATKDFGTLVKPEFGLVDYRYYYIQTYQGDDLTEETPIHQARATLGFTLFSKVDTTFIFAGNKFNETQKIKNRQPQMFAVLPVVSGDQFNMGVYTDIRFPMASKANTTEVGINPSFVQPINNEWSFTVDTEFDLIFSNNEDAAIENADLSSSALLLAPGSEDEYVGAKKDPDAEADVVALMKYKPAALNNKLSVAAGIEMNNHWFAKYRVNDETGVVEGYYEDVLLTVNRLKVDYQATENLKVTNDLYVATQGFYEERLDGAGHLDTGRLLNRIGLSYSLF